MLFFVGNWKGEAAVLERKWLVFPLFFRVDHFLPLGVIPKQCVHEWEGGGVPQNFYNAKII